MALKDKYPEGTMIMADDLVDLTINGPTGPARPRGNVGITEYEMLNYWNNVVPKVPMTSGGDYNKMAFWGDYYVYSDWALQDQWCVFGNSSGGTLMGRRKKEEMYLGVTEMQTYIVDANSPLCKPTNTPTGGTIGGGTAGWAYRSAISRTFAPLQSPKMATPKTRSRRATPKSVSNTSDVSIVIPFRNEGAEVFITIDSIIEHCGKVSIVVLNDGSDDNYDYSNLQNYDNITYIENEVPVGVATCRDMGVALVTTKYLIILDAHMRLFSNICASANTYLSSNPKTLLSFQTLFYSKDAATGELLTQNLEDTGTKNGHILFSDSEFLKFEYTYYSNDEKTIPEFIEVRCVMGAAYAIEKEYWEYLHGLNGLVEYGLDEQLLSIKVWLSGGKCVLKTNEPVAHIYRLAFPYKVNSDLRKSNALYMIRLLFPEREQNLIHLFSKESIATIDAKADFIKTERDYLLSIFQHDMSYVLQLNEVSTNK